MGIMVYSLVWVPDWGRPFEPHKALSLNTIRVVLETGVPS